MIQAIFTGKNPTSCPVLLSPTHSSKPPNSPLSPPNPKPHFPIFRIPKSQPHISPVARKIRTINASFDETYGASRSHAGINNNRASYNSDFDDFLSIIEFLTLASSAAISVYALSSSARNGAVLWGGRILAWQCVVLASGACVGAVMRRRQWRRIRGAAAGFPRGSYYDGVNLLGRVEKLEEDLRSSATIIRVLSRHIEKLGIRVRVARKALKEPISKTAALAQKNSEVTRALAAQDDVLENELGEIQKVLLAMQEQQQKQLELILAVAKAGKLLETKHVPSKNQNAAETSKSSVDGASNLEMNEIETLALQKQADEKLEF